MSEMTPEHKVMDEARIALGDPETSAQTLISLMSMITCERARKRPMTNQEMFKLDVLRRDAWDKLPVTLKASIETWEREMVGIDPHSISTQT